MIDKVATSSSEEDPPQPETAQPEVAAWVVTTGRTGASTSGGCLHVIGRCFRVPGVHYKCWKEVAATIPPGSYRKSCRQCFPHGHPAHDGRPAEVVDSKLDADMPETIANEDFSSSSNSE